MSTLNAHHAPKQTQDDGKPERPDPYQHVTDLIIEHLERGVVPWRCPWNREVGRPRNFQSGHAYQGVNVVLLGCRFAASPRWMSYRQAQARGGHVRKGEHGALVVKYGTYGPKEGPAVKHDELAKPSKRFLRTFVVFNATQIAGIAFPAPTALPILSPEQRIDEADTIVDSMPRRPIIRNGTTLQASYNPVTDEVAMPPFPSFESGESYYRTLHHELAHATGHPTRLNRESLTQHDGFGGKVYSKEELVAEMGAAFLANEADIVRDGHEQSAAYLNSWLTVLKTKDHRRWIVQAASQASRAAEFILRRTEEEDESEPHDACAKQDKLELKAELEAMLTRNDEVPAPNEDWEP